LKPIAANSSPSQYECFQNKGVRDKRSRKAIYYQVSEIDLGRSSFNRPLKSHRIPLLIERELHSLEKHLESDEVNIVDILWHRIVK
jgi:hypothetical protein